MTTSDYTIDEINELICSEPTRNSKRYNDLLLEEYEISRGGGRSIWIQTATNCDGVIIEFHVSDEECEEWEVI